MLRFVLVGLFALSMGWAAACECGEDCNCDPCKCEATAVAGAELAGSNGTANLASFEERVTKLPQDSGKPYLTVVTEPGNAVPGWFNEGNLKFLRNRAHFTVYASNTAIYKDRYAKFTPALPLVRLQTADGKVVYQASGANFPSSASAMEREIAQAMSEASIKSGFERRRGPCPLCPNKRSPCRPFQPEPETTPADPDPQPLDPEVVPDTVDSAPSSDLPPWWAAVLAGAVGAGAGVFSWWKKEYYGR